MVWALLAASSLGALKPHIVMILADDYGWYNIGYHGNKEVLTPNLDELVSEGVELDRHYAFKICSPSRSSFQSGRLPVHVNTENASPENINPKDPTAGYAGIAPNMTCVANKMKEAGYATHMTGKWDVGMATPKHTPFGRGYDSWLGYFHHANDYYSEELPLQSIGKVNVCGNKFVDFWKSGSIQMRMQKMASSDGQITAAPSYGAPASGLNGTVYEEELFRNHTISVIQTHATLAQSKGLAAGGAGVQQGGKIPMPLFLVHAFHLIHSPLQVPEEYIHHFPKVHDEQRQKYDAMVQYMDEVVGFIVAALKAQAMWDQTLLVFCSDNGGPIYTPAGANNWPLKGGKYSDWEGGVRVNAFVSGGIVPAAMRGTQLSDYIHICDWYATFCHLAGVDATDPIAKAAGLPAVDSINQWPLFNATLATLARTSTSTSTSSARDSSGGDATRTRNGGGEVRGRAPSPRTEVHLSDQALIRGQYKLVVGKQSMTGWTGEVYPNVTGREPEFPDIFHDIGTWTATCRNGGCFYDIEADPTEHHDLATTTDPTIREEFESMQQRLAELNKNNFNPDRGEGDKRACDQAVKNGGFYGPFIL